MRLLCALSIVAAAIAAALKGKGEAGVGRTNMKSVLILLLGVFGLAAGSFADAQQAWLLLPRAGHYELATTSAGAGRVETVLSLGQVAAYGQSAQALAFISPDPATRASRLDVLDKNTRRVVLTLPIDARLQAHMAGIIEDLVVSSRYVYFVSVRSNSAHQMSLNSLGGRLDLNQIRLSDGAIRTFPLPANCHTAHLVDYGGIPLVYAWNGTGVWKLDEESGALQGLLQERDVADISASEAGNCGCKTAPGPGPFADDIAIPGAGVFRVSRMGKLQKVLDAQLMAVSSPRPSVDLGLDLGPDGQFATLSRGQLNGQPVIGVLGVRGNQTVFQYRDPNTLAVQWQVHFPSSNVAPVRSSLAVPSGLLFVDQGQGTIDRATPAGTQVMWKLQDLDPSAVAAGTRVILFSDTPPRAGS